MIPRIECAHDEVWPIARLIPNPRNPNKHPPEQVALLSKIIEVQGWRSPIVVSTRSGFIVKGHGRLQAAQLAHMEEIPVDLQDYESEAAEWADLIADNRLGELAEMNMPELKNLLQDLDTGEIDMDLTGYTSDALEELMTQFKPEDETEGEGDATPDRAEELRVKWDVKAGQIWGCGPHRIMAGSCISEFDVSALMDRKRFVLGITSPPYASQRKYDESSGFKPIPPENYVEWFGHVQAQIGQHIDPEGSFFLNIKEHCEDGQRHLYVKELTISMVREWNWNFIDEFIWTHGGTPKAVDRRFKNGWEPIFQFAKGKFKFRPDRVRHETEAVPDWGGKHPSQEDGTAMQKFDGSGNVSKMQGSAGAGSAIRAAVVGNNSTGLAYPSNVLSLGKNREALGHGAAFPLNLPLFFLNAFSDEGDIAFDPFLGSGTTLIAAEKTKRVCYGMEISPGYVAVCLQRWADLTSQTPTLLNG